MASVLLNGRRELSLAKTMLPDFDKKLDEWKALNKTILIHAMGFNRTLQAGRSSFMNILKDRTYKYDT